MKEYTTTLFDIDGTLVTLDGALKSMHETISHFNLKPISDDRIKNKLLGRPLKDELPKMYPTISNKTDEVVKYYTDVFAHTFIEFESLQPHVNELFRRLKRDGIKIGLVTTRKRNVALAFTEKHAIPYDVLVSQNEVKNIKPDPESLVKALETLGSSSDDALMVGDHVFDIMAAASIDCDSVGVLTGISTKKELRQVGATYIIDNLEHLPGIMGLK